MIIYKHSLWQWGTWFPPSTIYLFMYLISQFMNNIRIVKLPNWKCQILRRIWSKYSFIDGEIKNGTGTLKYILAYSYSAMYSFKLVNPKGNQSWIFIGRTDAKGNSNTLATWCKELIHWKRLWCWERLKAGGEGDDRGWGGWMVSLTRWTWVWASSGSWWWTGKPGVLQSMGLQRVGHDWVTELSWVVNPSSVRLPHRW